MTRVTTHGLARLTFSEYLDRHRKELPVCSHNCGYDRKLAVMRDDGYCEYLYCECLVDLHKEYMNISRAETEKIKQLAREKKLEKFK